MSVARSGVSRWREPSRCDWNSAPSSLITRRVGQAEHLKATAVGEDRVIPADEAVKPAPARDQLVAGPQEQVIGVAEDDLGAELFQVALAHRLDGALRADRHERRRLHHAVRGRELAAARGAVDVSQREAGTSNTLTISTCEETSRWRDLRWTLRRARGLGRVGGVDLQASGSRAATRRCRSGSKRTAAGRSAGDGADGDLRRRGPGQRPRARRSRRSNRPRRSPAPGSTSSFRFCTGRTERTAPSRACSSWPTCRTSARRARVGRRHGQGGDEDALRGAQACRSCRTSSS